MIFFAYARLSLSTTQAEVNIFGRTMSGRQEFTRQIRKWITLWPSGPSFLAGRAKAAKAALNAGTNSSRCHWRTHLRNCIL